MALIVDIADAVVTALNGQEFSQAFEAARRYVVEFELEQLSELRVSVVPRAVDWAIVSRSKGQFDYEFDVALQKRSDPTDLEACDALMGLVEEVADFLRGLGRLVESPAAAVTGVRNEPVYGYTQLATQRVLTSVIRLSVRVIR
ncbi:MAG: hypothetical protein JXL80_18220 [Planctomycetes bacterium]|nr:hypothetical protein [Planctomycetota bacterium]